MTTTYDIYYKNQKTYIDTVEFNEIDSVILSDACEYYYSEDQRCPSDYVIINENTQEEITCQLNMNDVESYLCDSNPPMTNREFHLWANPSL